MELSSTNILEEEAALNCSAFSLHGTPLGPHHTLIPFKQFLSLITDTFALLVFLQIPVYLPRSKFYDTYFIYHSFARKIPGHSTCLVNSY